MSVEVRVRDCACPGLPHPSGDVVYLRDKPSVPLGLAVEADIIAAASNAQLLARGWALSYIRYGVTGWNFRDAKGERPVDVQELIDDYDMGMAVAEKADELYGDRVVNPLLERLFEPLQTGPTDDSTSANQATREQSEPSSPNTSADTKPSTEWTGTTSTPPDNSSPRNGSEPQSAPSSKPRTLRSRPPKPPSARLRAVS